MTDVILILVLALIAGLAAGYIFRAKKRGQKCIGCPYSGQCGGSTCSCTKNSRENDEDAPTEP